MHCQKGDFKKMLVIINLIANMVAYHRNHYIHAGLYIISTIIPLKKLLLRFFSFLNTCTCKTHFDQSGKNLPEYDNQTQIC